MEQNEVSKTNTTVQFSFKDLFINLKKKWIVTLIVGLVALIVSCTGLMFVSKGSNTYVSKIHAEWPGLDENQYPNGRPFNFRTLVSKDNLEKVKASSEDFKNIDVEKMYDDNGIEITQRLEEKVNGKKESGYNHYYTITVKQKYFDNSKQATAFVSKMVEDSTFNKAHDEIANYKLLNYFASQTDLTEYTEMIANIQNQVTLQSKILEKLIKESSQDFIYDLENNKTLGSLAIEYDSFLKNNDYKQFASMMKENNYVRNVENSIKVFENKIKVIDNEIKSNNDKILEIQNSFNNGNYGDEKVPTLLAELALRNVELKNEKEYYQNAILNGNFNKEFDDAIDAYQAEILEFNTKIEKAYHEVNEPKTFLEYEKNKVIVEDGMGLLKIGVFGIVFTIVVEFILSLILTYSVNKKKELA